MKILVAAALLLALATPAYAADDGSSLWNCPHGVQVTRQADGTFSANPPTKRTIRQAWDIDAPSPGDYVVQLDGKDCKYLTPYQRGMRDYREGLCFRARPYTDHGPEQTLWIRGYEAHQTAKISKRNDEHCHAIKEKYLDNSLEECVPFIGKTEIADESAVESCQRIGAKAYVKEVRKKRP